jgi:hypothetical protein
VAAKHDLQLTDEHFTRAIEPGTEEATHYPAQNPAHSMPEERRNASKPSKPQNEKTPTNVRDFVTSGISSETCETAENAGNAQKRTRTSKGFYSHQHLKLARLPISPSGLGDGMSRAV